MKKENLTLIVILSMLAGIGIMRTLDVVFGGYKPVTCRMIHLKKLSEEIQELKNYFDGDVKNGE